MTVFRKIPWLFFLLLPFWGSAQSCGCDDCGIIIPVTSLETHNFIVNDLVNNDLADPAQGICGVELHFTHNRVRGLEITLISPSGQQILLVGENLPNPTITTTLNSVWDITFVRSGDPASPDPGIGATWSNGANWVNAANYNGNYYPRNGNLEDFNIGTVNGTWQLIIQNHNFFPTYTGELIGFRLIFCDPEGLSCCFAEAGEIQGANRLDFCKNDPDLLLTPNLQTPSPPDPTLHTFNWLIGQDTVLLDYLNTPQVDLTNYPAGEYEICGLSYLNMDLDSLPTPNGIIRWDDLKDTVEQTDPPFCADISSRCLKVIIHEPPADTPLADTICIGESYPIGDSTFTLSGNYDVVFQLANGCDSVIKLDLEVLLPDTTYLDETICFNTSFSVGANTYNQSGVYLDTFPTSSFCDSIVKLDLTVLPVLETDIAPIICQGDTFQIGGQKFHESGNYQVILTSQLGNCDSLIRIGLSVLKPEAIIDPASLITCDDPQIQLVGANSNPSGRITHVWFTTDGQISGNTNQPNIMVSDSGTYELIVSQDSLGKVCLDRDTIKVALDKTAPIVSVLPPLVLTCDRPDVILDGSNSSQGADYQYFWKRNGSQITPNVNNDSLSGNEIGTYTLIVENNQTGCRDSATVTLTEDITDPIAEAGNTDELNCTKTIIDLDGTGSSTGANFDYQWTGVAFISGETTLTPRINQPGMYYLNVENTTNGCAAIDSVLITQDTDLPFAEAGIDDTLNCRDLALQLVATGSSGTDFNYQWTTLGGNISQQIDDFTIEVDAIGEYIFEVSNSVTNCVKRDTVEIFLDRTIPTVHPGRDSLLTCDVTSIELGGLGTDSGTPFQLQWFEGSIPIVGANSDRLVVSDPAIYSLEVINTQNFCSETRSVTISQDITPPTVDPGVGFELNCIIDKDTLDATNGTDSGIDFSYQWTGAGITCCATTLEPEVNQPGWYVLEVENDRTGCTTKDSVEVTQDEDIPIALAGMADTLNCQDSILTLSGNGSTTGTNIQYNWTTTNGNIRTANPNIIDIEIDQPGRYVFAVLNSDNQCEKTDTVFIAEDIFFPIVDAGKDTTLTCSVDEIELGTNLTSVGNEFTYQWFRNGSIIANETNPTIRITEQGTYTLTVTNGTNFCESSDEVIVGEDKVFPTAEAGADLLLDCTTTFDTIDGSQSQSGLNIDYQWFTDTGCINTPIDTNKIEVNCDGWYFLQVTDLDNGCVSLDSAFVREDSNVPTAFAGRQDTLNCVDRQLTLSGNASPATAQISWTTTGGRIVSGANTLTPIIDRPGVYELRVFDAANNCEKLSTVEIFQFIEQPEADAGADHILNCEINRVKLGGSFNTTGSNITYQWFDFLNTPIVGADSIGFETIGSGAYILEVTDTRSLCVDRDTVLVDLDRDEPISEAGLGATLTCTMDTFRLTGSTDIVNFNLQWQTDTGQIIEDGNTLMPLVSADGMYYLTITNPDNKCTAIDSVLMMSDGNLPVATTIDTMYLPCGANAQVQLDATGSSDASNFVFEWTTSNGNILSGDNTLTPIANRTGNYLFEVTNTINDCKSSANVFVFDSIKPVVIIIEPIELDCNELITGEVINASGSSKGSHFEYEWVTFGGNFLSRTDTLTPVINRTGTYGIQITDTRNGCIANADVGVTSSPEIPIANAGADMRLPCEVDTFMIDGSLSSPPAPEIVFNWRTNFGNIISGSNTNSILVDSSAVYILEVTNTNSNCTVIDSVDITFLPCNPNVNVLVTDTITCEVDRVRLDGSGSQLTDATFFWKVLAGEILEDGNTPTPLVSAGSYQFVVINTTTGLSDSSFVVDVPVDTLHPTSDAGLPQVLTCDVLIADLDGSPNSSIGNQFAYQWTGLGNIQNPTTLQPSVDVGGRYELLVTNRKNGCFDTSSVLVTYDTLHPIAVAGADKTFPCDTAFILLDGTGSDSGSGFSILWDNNETALLPRVTSPGTYCIEVTRLSNGCKSTDCVEITEDQNAPQIQVSDDEIFTCKDTLFRLTSALPQGNLDLYWETFDGCIVSDSLLADIEVNCPGSYTLVVTDLDNRCKSTETVIVTEQINEPDAEAGTAVLLTCADTLLQLDGTDSEQNINFEYAWKGTDIRSGALTLTPTIADTGFYYLTVRDTSTGCFGIDSVLVNDDVVPPIADAGADGKLTCNNLTLTLNGLLSTPTGDYEWTTITGNFTAGQTTLEPTIDDPGFYILEVTDPTNGCVATDTAVVVPDFFAPIINFNNSDPYLLTCEVDTIQLSAAASTPMDSINFRWTTLSGNILDLPVSSTISVDESGFYFLTATQTDNGCESKDTVFVAEDREIPAIATSDPNKLTCDSTKVAISAIIPDTITNYDLEWSSLSGNILTAITAESIEVDAAERYAVQITNLDNGCTNTASTFVEIDTISPIAIAAVDAFLDCFNNTVSLDGTQSSSNGGTYSYEWTTVNGGTITNPNSLTPIANSQGTYFLSVKNNINGCSSIDSVVVSQDASAIGSLEIDLQPMTCFGFNDAVLEITNVAGGTPPFSYSIDGTTFFTFPEFPNLEAGIYDLLIEDAAGCQKDTTIIVYGGREVLIDLGTDLTIELGDSIELEALVSIPQIEVASLAWKPVDELPCQSCFIQNVRPLLTTEYAVTVRDSNGCFASDRILITVNSDRPIYIPSGFSPDDDGTNDVFMIYGKKGAAEVELFQIYDRWGNIVHEAKEVQVNDPSFGWDGKFNGQPMNENVFVYRAEIRFPDGRTEVFTGDLTLIR